MRADQDTNENQDQAALEDDVLEELERIDQSLLDELVEDTRLASGVPEEQRGSDLQFIEMSGLTSPAPAQSNSEDAPESSVARSQPPIDFYEEGVDDVDEAAEAGIQGRSHGTDSGSHIAELKDIVEELSREPADAAPPPPEEAEPDSAPVDAFPDELEQPEEEDFDSVLPPPADDGTAAAVAHEQGPAAAYSAPEDAEEAVSQAGTAEETGTPPTDVVEERLQPRTGELEDAPALPAGEVAEPAETSSAAAEESVAPPVDEAEEPIQPPTDEIEVAPVPPADEVTEPAGASSAVAEDSAAPPVEEDEVPLRPIADEIGDAPAPPADEVAEPAEASSGAAEDSVASPVDEAEELIQPISGESEDASAPPASEPTQVVEALSEAAEDSVAPPVDQTEEPARPIADELEDASAPPASEPTQVVEALSEAAEDSVAPPVDQAEEPPRPIADELEDASAPPASEPTQVVEALSEAAEDTTEVAETLPDEDSTPAVSLSGESAEPAARDGDEEDISSLLEALDEADAALEAVPASPPDSPQALATEATAPGDEPGAEVFEDGAGDAEAALRAPDVNEPSDSATPPDAGDVLLPSLSQAEELLDELQAQERDVPALEAEDTPDPQGPEAPLAEEAHPTTLSVEETSEPSEQPMAPEEAEESYADNDPSARVFRRPRGRQGRHRRRGRRRLRRFVYVTLGLIVIGGFVAFAGIWLYEWGRMQLATPAKQFDEGVRAFEAGNYSAAASTFSGFADENLHDPRRAEAQFRAALTTQLAGDTSPETASEAYERSMDLFEQFLADNPEHAKAARAQNLRGILLFKLGRYEESIDILSSPGLGLRDPGGALPAVRTLARAYAAIGDYQAAASGFTKAATLDGNPSPDEDYLSLGTLYESLAQQAATEAERREYQKSAISHWERAIQMPAIEPGRKGEIGVKIAVLSEKLSTAATAPDQAPAAPAEAEAPEPALAPQTAEEAATAPEPTTEPTPVEADDPAAVGDGEETRDADS